MTAFLLRDAKPQAAEKSGYWALREDERGAAGLRSDPIHSRTPWAWLTGKSEEHGTGDPRLPHQHENGGEPPAAPQTPDVRQRGPSLSTEGCALPDLHRVNSAVVGRPKTMAARRYTTFLVIW